MGFKETIHKNVDQTSWHGAIPVHYRYTYGLAGERFFKGIKEEGKFYGTVSPAANKVYCPPAIFCEESYEALDQWVELPDVGTVESYTVCFQDYTGAEQEPVVVAAVRLDGADTVFVHRLGCDPDLAYIGMRVKAKFLPKAKRVGHLNDVECFEPTA